MDGFVIYNGAKTAPVIIDIEACAQIRRAADDLRQDIAMVTGALLQQRHDLPILRHGIVSDAIPS